MLLHISLQFSQNISDRLRRDVGYQGQGEDFGLVFFGRFDDLSGLAEQSDPGGGVPLVDRDQRLVDALVLLEQTLEVGGLYLLLRSLQLGQGGILQDVVLLRVAFDENDQVLI